MGLAWDFIARKRYSITSVFNEQLYHLYRLPVYNTKVYGL